MNMMTSLENIPLKTSSSSNDDSDDPLVKDILNEFNQEINNQHQQQPIQNPQPINEEYIINNNINKSPKQQIQQFPPNYNKNNSTYYNEDFLRKSAIIIIIIAFIFSPFIYNSFVEKLPPQISSILTDYDFYFKLFLVYIIIYILMIKKLI
jgi:hypothetical protein